MVRRTSPPGVGQISRFSNGKVDNSTLIKWFCEFLTPIASKLQGPGPYNGQIIWDRTAFSFFEKLCRPPPGCFRQKYSNIGPGPGPKKGPNLSKLVPNNPKWSQMGPKLFLNPFGPFLGPYGPIGPQKGPKGFKIVWDPFGTIWDHFGPIWVLFGPGPGPNI